MIPQPRLRIDLLADRAEDAKRLAPGFLDRPVALAHQGANRRRRGIENVDRVLVAHLPEAGGVGIGGDALEHQGYGAVGQRPVDDVTVSGPPADVGGAPEYFAVLVVEHILV